jgi:hypothetical protein
MQCFSAVLFLTMLLSLGSVFCFLPAVNAGAIDIKARNGNAAARNNIRADDANAMRDIFNETFTLEQLLLPAGFRFSDPDLNITREAVGDDMIAFSDSELDKIPGANVFKTDKHAQLVCETSGGSPHADHVKFIGETLSGYGMKWCCQMEPDKCTRMMYNQLAASDICAPWTPSVPQCLRCKDAGYAVNRIYEWCTSKKTQKTGGFVRYVSLLVNCIVMLTLYSSFWAYDPSLSFYGIDVNVYHL